jgi:hypothetical protein
MAENAYWFARRFPVGHPRNAMAPVSREGRLVALGFLLGMMVGGVGFVGLAISGLPIPGVLFFVVLAALSGWAFIKAAVSRGDHQRTVDDYRRMKSTGRV